MAVKWRSATFVRSSQRIFLPVHAVSITGHKKYFKKKKTKKHQIGDIKSYRSLLNCRVFSCCCVSKPFQQQKTKLQCSLGRKSEAFHFFQASFCQREHQNNRFSHTMNPQTHRTFTLFQISINKIHKAKQNVQVTSLNWCIFNLLGQRKGRKSLFCWELKQFPCTDISFNLSLGGREREGFVCFAPFLIEIYLPKKIFSGRRKRKLCAALNHSICARLFVLE